MSKNVKGVNNVDFRRTWDKEEFSEKAKAREEKVRRAVCRSAFATHVPTRSLPLPVAHRHAILQEKKNEDEALEAKKRKRLERDPLHQGLIVARANLKARDYQIDLAAKLNKTQVRASAEQRTQQASCTLRPHLLRPRL